MGFPALGKNQSPCWSHRLSGTPGWCRVFVWQGGHPGKLQQASALQSVRGCLGWDVVLVVSSPPSYPSHATTFSPLPEEQVFSLLWWENELQGFGQQGRRFLLANKSHLTLPCLQAPSSRSCLSTWLAPGRVSPGALARSPCPSEDDEGCCLMRPVCLPGIVLSLVHGCWGRICLLQPSKGTGSGFVSSSCPTAVSHQDFCFLIWMCREATDR